MLFTEKLSQLVAVTGLSLALMALAGCGGAGGDPNARSDEELWALANQAATDSGFGNFQTINAGNADGIYDEVLGAVTDGYLVALSNAAPGAALSLPASAPRAAFETLSGSTGQSRLLGEPPGTGFLTETYDLGGTWPCSSGVGTVSATGRVVGEETGDEYNGSVSADLQDLDLTFVACEAYFYLYTLWGSARFNVESTVSWSTSGSTGNLTLRADEFVDGGLAITNGLDNYSLIFSLSAVLFFTSSVDLNTGQETPGSSNVALTLTLSDGGNDCTATIASVDEIPTWTCS